MAGRMSLLWRVAPLVLLVAVTPVAISPSRGLSANDAWCNDGTCCPEQRSWCNIGGGVDHENYYSKYTGSCRDQS